MNNCREYWLHALTPIHIGTGEGVHFIDLPIAREKVTNLPVVPGSAIKGVLADCYGATEDARKSNAELRAAFGIAGDEHANAGALVFTDARLVCLPVKSLFGTFAWVTAPFVLKRLARDFKIAGLKLEIETPPVENGKALVTDSSCLKSPNDDNPKLFLAELDFEARQSEDVTKLADAISNRLFDNTWRDEFKKRLAVVSDDTFSFFSEHATEIRTRICMDDEHKKVRDHGLWTEEYLPTESILAGLVWCDKLFLSDDKAAENLTPRGLIGKFCTGEKHLQIGGNATVGLGQVRCVFRDGGK